jgi:hypothetical protein
MHPRKIGSILKYNNLLSSAMFKAHQRKHCVQVSAENAVILMNTQQVPLLIDPSTQASAWLKQHESKAQSSVECTTMHNPRFSTALEGAVRFGKVCPPSPAPRACY